MDARIVEIKRRAWAVKKWRKFWRHRKMSFRRDDLNAGHLASNGIGKSLASDRSSSYTPVVALKIGRFAAHD